MKYELIKSDEFADWLNHLKDKIARVKILQRMERARFGNLGDHKNIGDGLIEFILFHSKRQITCVAYRRHKRTAAKRY